ncbi:hypothetical protein DFP75_104211 [Marinomonas alcarazii]|uniref:Uncharacterized protein n=1 Tax=Marinomonas alcarazii TaxID=491949 RepID=A0A318V1R0_9GAMM|nr:hypothetical protein [Marinomonas alcarazii]PYF81750.1 hypothetical protein DFP75_104211 [Marinomonas alcarazii]
MAGLDNGVTNLSLPIAQIESALHEYAYSPADGIAQLQQSLLSIKNLFKSSFPSPLCNQRLLDILSAVDMLLAQGAPYDREYHLAFLSATDAIIQVIIASQIDAERVNQLEALLSAERSCWQVVLSFSEQSYDEPSYKNFEASLDGNTNSLISIDTYLKGLSRVGKVSFQLDSFKNSVVMGRFSLVSVQSLSWLQDQFPDLHWKVLPKNSKETLRELCELSFLPLFQNTAMPRDLRYRLLDRFDVHVKAGFYKGFSDCFRTDVPLLNSANRLVPMAEHVVPIQVEEGRDYLPVRHGGSVYLATLESGQLSYLSCLGRDYLAYTLYEIESSFGTVVFDRAECLGKFLVTEESMHKMGERWMFSMENRLEAEVVFDMPLFSKVDAFCLLPSSIREVLVVQQGGRYFAIPYLFIREIEAVASQMPSPRLWVKNVWLSSLNEPLLEPWLLNAEGLPVISSWQSSKREALPTKNGYYSGSVCGRMCWVEASLVMALLPYQPSKTVTSKVGSRLEFGAFVVHDGRCYDRVISELPFDLGGAFSSDDPAFTVVLEWMGASVVLSLSGCDWSSAVPEADYIQDFVALDNAFNSQRENTSFSYADHGDILITKKNFVSFVAGVWPSLLLA